MDLRAAAARLIWPVLGLPTVPDTPGEKMGWPAAFTDPGRGPTPTPRPLVPYLRWLARTRPVVFHGSQRRGLVELDEKRSSRDTRAYGDQISVFASQDPVWGALLRCTAQGHHAFDPERSLGSDRGIDDRRYLFSVDTDAEVFAPGALYVLPADGFAHEPRLAGLFDTAHQTRRGTVRPMAWFAVEPDDFPLAERTLTHTVKESMGRSIWEAGWGHRRWPRTSRC